QFAAQRAFVQCLDVFEPMFEAITAQIDFVFRHRVKHEGVVRVGGMSQGEDFVRHARTLMAARSVRKIRNAVIPSEVEGPRRKSSDVPRGPSTSLGMTGNANAVCVCEPEPIICIAWQNPLSAKVSAR